MLMLGWSTPKYTRTHCCAASRGLRLHCCSLALYCCGGGGVLVFALVFSSFAFVYRGEDHGTEQPPLPPSTRPSHQQIFMRYSSKNKKGRTAGGMAVIDIMGAIIIRKFNINTITTGKTFFCGLPCKVPLVSVQSTPLLSPSQILPSNT